MDYAKTLSEQLLALRKSKGLTQEDLATQLGISYQAVSKWENGQSCPDIALLPRLAEIYEVTIDSLFGLAAAQTEPAAEPSSEEGPIYVKRLPWLNDSTIHMVVYRGHKMLKRGRDLSNCTFTYQGDPLAVECRCALRVEGTVHGNAVAGSHIECHDIGNNVTAGSHIECHDIGGNATAGSHIECANIGGNANAGASVKCRGVEGNINAVKVSVHNKD